MWVDFDVRDNRRWTFTLDEALLLIMDLYFGHKWWFKNVLMNLFLTNAQLLASQDINWWTGVVWITCGWLWCFYQLFGLSFWRHPFTAEDPLLSKWCNDTFLQNWWRNKLIYILDGLRVSTFSANYSSKAFRSHRVWTAVRRHTSPVHAGPLCCSPVSAVGLVS